MSLQADIENHVRTHPHVWIKTGKTAKVDGQIIDLWCHVLRTSDEYKEYLANRNL